MQKEKLLIISFDFIKKDYPATTYSIASIITSLRSDKELIHLQTKHYKVNLSDIYEKFTNNIVRIKDFIKNKLEKELKKDLQKYNFIAIGATTWSTIYVKLLTNEILKAYKGIIILGGYEITACSNNELLSNYPNVHFFIKGYAETALKNILKRNYTTKQKIIQEKVKQEDLISPYLSSFFSTNHKKVHWETKRGCPYKCGFCEWGNAADKKVIPINEKRLSAEISLFSKSKVQEINILDGTFNFGTHYVDYLRKLLNATKANITMQVRFENVANKQGKRFLDLCKKYNHRIKLEFGLQTIHPSEMQIIGRINNLDIVKTVMKTLNQYNIYYEISLIYGIPGQTYKSFLETIQFVKANGCENIRAFPLRIPKNSKMEIEKYELRIKESKLNYGIYHVTSSFSFNKDDYEKMQKISKKLAIASINNLKIKNNKLKNYFTFTETNPYEWKLNKAI